MKYLRLLALTLALLLHTPSAPAQEEETDFRALQAPAEVHILESPKLHAELQLAGEQAERIDQRLKLWKTEYLRKQAELAAIPPGDPRHRGFPPTRDRPLDAELREVLTAEQQQSYQAMVFAWNFGPLGRRGSSLRFSEELGISVKQQRDLHDLQVDWVLSAHQTLQEFMGGTTSERITVVEKIAVMLWEHKPRRDRRWEQILTAEQARRWRQLELQLVLWQEPRLLVTDYRERAKGHVLVAGAYLDFQVPYFEPPADALDLKDDQIAQMNAVYEQLEQDAEQFKRPEAREDWNAHFMQYLALKRESMRQLEAIMTDAQRQKWRGMLGELTASTKKWLP